MADEQDGSNKFANDGSFMEMFRKRMEEQQKAKTDKESKKSKPEAERTFVKSDSVDEVKDSEKDKKPKEDKPYQVVLVCTSVCGLERPFTVAVVAIESFNIMG